MNWLLAVTAVIFIVCIVIGFMRGFLRIGLSLTSTIITLVLVSVLSPYVSAAIEAYTPIDDYIEEHCLEMFMTDISADELLSMDLSGTALEGLDTDEIESINETDWDLLGITAEDILSVVEDPTADEQIRIIESASIPQFLKDLLLENNNSAIYEELGVTTFPEYAAAYISRMVLNLISFIVTFLLAIILVKALAVAVHIIGDLPLLGLINHIAGGALGVVLALIIIWLLFLVITLLYSTAFGTACFTMIEQSDFLQYLYNLNPMLNHLLAF